MFEKDNISEEGRASILELEQLRSSLKENNSLMNQMATTCPDIYNSLQSTGKDLLSVAEGIILDPNTSEESDEMIAVEGLSDELGKLIDAFDEEGGDRTDAFESFVGDVDFSIDTLSKVSDDISIPTHEQILEMIPEVADIAINEHEAENTKAQLISALSTSNDDIQALGLQKSGFDISALSGEGLKKELEERIKLIEAILILEEEDIDDMARSRENIVKKAGLAMILVERVLDLLTKKGYETLELDDGERIFKKFKDLYDHGIEERKNANLQRLDLPATALDHIEKFVDPEEDSKHISDVEKNLEEVLASMERISADGSMINNSDSIALSKAIDEFGVLVAAYWRKSFEAQRFNNNANPGDFNETKEQLGLAHKKMQGFLNEKIREGDQTAKPLLEKLNKIYTTVVDKNPQDILFIVSQTSSSNESPLTEARMRRINNRQNRINEAYAQAGGQISATAPNLMSADTRTLIEKRLAGQIEGPKDE